MSFIQRELDRIGNAIRQSNPVPHYDELYAAQQALMWALDPSSYKSPYDLLVPISDLRKTQKVVRQEMIILGL